MTSRFSSFVVFVAPFCFPSQHHRCCDLRFCVGSFSVIVRAITKPLPQRLWTSKHSVGSGSGPASSVFKNCKFSFFSFLLFFFAESFRNFHPQNSRFTLCSCLFFYVQELPLCVLFFFSNSAFLLTWIGNFTRDGSNSPPYISSETPQRLSELFLLQACHEQRFVEARV